VGARASRNGFGLTPRELQTLALVVRGHTNRDIAEQLHISSDTVKHHLTSIFNKTGASNRLELALFAIHHGLIPRDGG
jgi:DNA-binding CsgD family transcriptional regulator